MSYSDFTLKKVKSDLKLELLEKPIITIVEAKNENIIGGLGQCISEMYAAKVYNQQENYD